MDVAESFLAYVRGRTTALSRIAYLLTADAHLAEDLVQETLLRVAGRWPRIVAAGDPDAYVRRVLYHQHVSSWRRRRGRTTVLVPDPPDRQGPDESAAVGVIAPELVEERRSTILPAKVPSVEVRP